MYIKVPRRLLLLFLFLGINQVYAHSIIEAPAALFDQKNDKTLGLPKLASTRVTLYSAQADTNKYSHHPMIVNFRDKLYAMWSSGLTTEDSSSQSVLYATSADGSQWSNPDTLAIDPDGANGVKRLVAGGWLIVNNQLYALFSEFTVRDGHWDTMVLRAKSTTDGIHWEEAFTGGHGILLSQSPFALKGGKYLFVGDTLSGPQIQVIEKWGTARCAATSVTHVKFPQGTSLVEANVYRQESGKLTCLLRDVKTSCVMFATVARDGNGRTWEDATATTFPDSSARARIGRFEKGPFWLLSNPSKIYGKRNPLVISLSQDGRMFDHAFVVRDEPVVTRFPDKTKGGGYGYPDATVFRGRMYVIYSKNKEDIEVTSFSLVEPALAKFFPQGKN